MVESVDIPLHIPALPFPVPAALPLIDRLPDVDRNTALEAWLYGITYLQPASGRVMREIEKYDPIELIAMGMGFVPASLPATFMMVTSKLFAPNFKDPFSQLGFDIISVGTIDNNLRLQTMLQNTGIAEFNTQGWINGLTKFREQIAETIKFDVHEFPVIPYIDIGVKQLDFSSLTQQKQFEYSIYYCDMVWIEYQVNLARRAFPPIMPMLDSTLASFSIINARYGQYIEEQAASPFATKQMAKTMFGADSDIYHGLWLLLYDNDAAYRDTDFITGANKMSELLQIAAYNTGV